MYAGSRRLLLSRSPQPGLKVGLQVSDVDVSLSSSGLGASSLLKDCPTLSEKFCNLSCGFCQLFDRASKSKVPVQDDEYEQPCRCDIIALMSGSLPHTSNGRIYKWLYCQNLQSMIWGLPGLLYVKTLSCHPWHIRPRYYLPFS